VRHCTPIWNNKGAALTMLGRKAEALQALDQALAPAENAIWWNNRAVALRGLGRIAEVEEAERTHLISCIARAAQT
jgi:hypothetical protein